MTLQSENDVTKTMTSSERSITDKSQTTSDPDQDLCPVCSTPSLISCRTCKKINYCSKPHQRIHWKSHKAECYPVIEEKDEILGHRLLATRNIKPGEIILREKPLLSIPSGKMRRGSGTYSLLLPESSDSKPGEKSICLGCFALIVKSNYFCPTCSWPFCGPTCVEDVQHRENECEIFASRKIQPLTHLVEVNKEEEVGSVSLKGKYEYKYQAITILRGVLLKEKDPLKWQRLGEFHSQALQEPQKQDQNLYNDLTLFCNNFIQNTCKLAQFTREDIDLVLRVIMMTSTHVFVFDGDDDSLKFSCDEDLFSNSTTNSRNTLHLCYIAQLASQSCVPNASWMMHKNDNSEWEIFVRATIPIRFGERITLSYYAEDVTRGIMDRFDIQRRKLFGESEKENNITTSKNTCLCERCTDPSELGTFFSAIKCPCHSGYLLPVINAPSLSQIRETDGLNTRVTEWKCTECFDKVSSEFCDQILFSVRKDLTATSIYVETSNNSTAIDELFDICNRHSGETLHFNHFLIYKIEMEILRRISNLFAQNVWASWDDRYVVLVERMMKICIKWLEVAEVLWRGITKQRGLLLYYLQEAMVINLITGISKIMRNKVEGDKKVLEQEFTNILNIRRDVLQIFCLDSEGSFGNQIAQSMVNGCPEIVILKKHFDCCVQNGC